MSAPETPQSTAEAGRPLAGLRVLDLGQNLAGPYCAMQLADLGCDVIKVEPPGRGDAARHALGTPAPWGESGAVLAINRNKRSMTLNLKDPRGVELFKDLARTADVVIESFRPGTMQRLGVGYEVLSELNPQLVYGAISGFGATGPRATQGGYDIIAQGASGIMSVTGSPDQPPARAGVPITDIGAGLQCTVAILGALLMRSITNKGQMVDTSLFEAGISFGVWETTELWIRGLVAEPLGSAHRMSAPYQAIEVADGHITIGANHDGLWRAVTDVLGHPEWAEEPRFRTNADRLAHQAELIDLIESVTRTEPGQVWLARLDAAGVPSGPVQNYAELMADEQFLAREMVLEADHPQAGRIKMLGVPWKLSGTPTPVRRPPPMLGEHTDDVLRELGLSDDELQSLKTGGTV